MVVTPASSESSSSGTSTPSSLSPRRDHVFGGIESPRVAPHRLGLQSRKSCFKPPERLEQRVRQRARFAAHARCVVTGAVVEPHPRDHVEWKAACREQRILAGPREEDADDAEVSAGESSPCDGSLTGAGKNPDPNDPDTVAEVEELKRRHREAKQNMAYLKADCRYASKKTRHHHPCLTPGVWSP